MTSPMASTPENWDYAQRLLEVQARVVAAESASGRAGSGVKILVATKSWDAAATTAVINAGASIIGESKMQELQAKGPALAKTRARVHVIGELQRNKAGAAVEWASCVQTVTSLPLAQKLSLLCERAERSLDVMVQVNVSGESSKAGLAPNDALAFAAEVQDLPHLTVTGLMTIGLNSTDESAVRAGYATLRELRDQALVRSERGELNLREAWELSMGMSRDLEWAISEGATIVRVGTAIMGGRSSK